jgi:hypothetical protein
MVHWWVLIHSVPTTQNPPSSYKQALNLMDKVVTAKGYFEPSALLDETFHLQINHK